MGHTIAIGLIPSYFSVYKNVATNIITISPPLSIMVSAPLTQLLIDIYGWRGAMLLLGGLNLHYITAAAVLKPVIKDEIEYHEISEHSFQNKQSDIKKCKYEHINIFLESILNVSFLKNVSFLIVLIISMISGYTFNGWMVYLVSILQRKGLTAFEAANSATISGLGAFLIRIVLAVIQGKATYYKQLFCIGTVLVMMSFGGMYFATSFWFVSWFSLTLGVGYSMQGSQTYNAAYAIVDKDDVVGAVAWISLSHGLGYITSGYISGKFCAILQPDTTRYVNGRCLVTFLMKFT